jgi:hypothetical protein
VRLSLGPIERSPRFRFVLAVWAGAVAYYLLLGGLGHHFLSTADFIGAYHEPPGVLHYWSHWDGAWFDRIAQHGYETENATAFFPFFPLVLRGVTELGPPIAIAGVVVATLALLGTLFFLYELALTVVGEPAAKRATIAFAAFPTSFFLVASYSEALFLFLSAGCLWGIFVHRDLTFAAPFAYCAALTRSVGVFLVIPLAYTWLRGRRELGWPTLVAVAAPVLGLLAYMAYLWRVAREPFLFTLAYERGWGRSLANPVTTIVHGARVAHEGEQFLWAPWRVFQTTSANPPFALANSLNLGFCVVVLVLLVLAFVRLPLSLALYAVPLSISPLTVLGTQQPLASMPRYAVSVLPLFLVLGGLFVRWRALFFVWCALSVAVGVVLTLEFVTWRWVA